ncbi:hypothetical protein JKP88DRAFT_156261, partial [Tribonema minus]
YRVWLTNVYGNLATLSVDTAATTLAGAAATAQRAQAGATEVQSVTVKGDTALVREVQSIAITGGPSAFTVTLLGDTVTVPSGATKAVMAAKLESLVNVTSVIVDTDDDAHPALYTVTFVDPVGDVPPMAVTGLSGGATALVTQETRGEFPVSGTFTLSFRGAYTDDIAVDATAAQVKAALEDLSTVTSVHVVRAAATVGYTWWVTFTGDQGDLENMVVYNNRWEVQQVAITGGTPTPLRGSFTLSYGASETAAIAYDATAAEIAAALQALQSVGRVDVTATGAGLFEVTFRDLGGDVQPLGTNADNLTGSSPAVTVTQVVQGLQPSVTTPAPESLAQLSVAEQEEGFPRYQGAYAPLHTGPYQVAVSQLLQGGLIAQYFDNQWLLGPPAEEMVAATIDFDWGAGAITAFGRDYVSARYAGKLRAPASEAYALRLRADDGARLFINHVLVIDAWDGALAGDEARATVDLVGGEYVDVVLEYKEETGAASVQLRWSSYSTPPQVIPSSALFYALPVVGSPWAVDVVPGALTYPWTDATGNGLTHATAGEPAEFIIQAKDALGNDLLGALEGGDGADFLVTLDGPGTVELGAGSVGAPEDLGGGQYRVVYTATKAGAYALSVRTPAGMDIYCGRGQADKCSPFAVTVSPGPAVGAVSEAQADLSAPLDWLTYAVAGRSGYFRVQAKDAHGNNRGVGGDAVAASLVSTAGAGKTYHAAVQDAGTGVYTVIYTVPRAGSYAVTVTVGGEPVLLCTPRPASEVTDALAREYNGVVAHADKIPTECLLAADQAPPHDALLVVHGDLFEPACTATGVGLSAAAVGVPAQLAVQARDAFGNLRDGTDFPAGGTTDGKSDVFLVRLSGPGGYEVVTSTAVVTATVPAASPHKSFQLSFAGATTLALNYTSSAEVVQAALAIMLGDGETVSTRVTQAGSVLTITFLSHLVEFGSTSTPLTATQTDVHINKVAAGGEYPVTYTVWYKGLYTLEITGAKGGQLIEGSPLVVTVAGGAASALTSTVEHMAGSGMAAGEGASITVQVRDVAETEVQAIVLSTDVPVPVPEVQTLTISSFAGTVDLMFAGETIATALSSGDDLQAAFDAIPWLNGAVTVSPAAVAVSTLVTITFDGAAVAGDVPMISSSSAAVSVQELTMGVAPFRPEVQAYTCGATTGTNIVFTYRNTVVATIDAAASLTALKNSFASSLLALAVTITSAQTTVCGASTVYISFDTEKGDVPALTFSAGASLVTTKGLAGQAPYWGTFTLSFEGAETAPLNAYASAADVEAALEALPTIGGVTVTADFIGTSKSAVAPDLLPVYTVAFNGKCSGADAWAACPAHRGDQELLQLDASHIAWPELAAARPAAPVAHVLELVQGTAGNDYVEAASASAHVINTIAATLKLDSNASVGVGMTEVLQVVCDAATGADASAAVIDFVFGLSDPVSVSGAAPSAAFEAALRAPALTGDAGLTVTYPTGQTTLCAMHAKAVTIRFSAQLTQPPLQATVSSAAAAVAVAVTELVTGVDGMTDLGDGLFRVDFTPVVAGHYALTVSAVTPTEQVATDLSAGWDVVPAAASAVQSTFATARLATQGVPHTLSLQAKDQFGNPLDGAAADAFAVEFAGPGGVRVRADVASAALPNTDGTYTATATLQRAGMYRLAAAYRASGGLLATFYRDTGLAASGDAVLVNNDHLADAPYHAGAFCPAGYGCDATRVAHSIAYAWGASAPLDAAYGCPADYFSVAWEGEVLGPVTSDVTFVVRASDAVRLTVGGAVVIDTTRSGAAAPAGAVATQRAAVAMVQGELQPILLEFVAGADAAAVSLQWSHALQPTPINVPASALYYTRALSGSPVSLVVVPGALSAETSSADGAALAACVANAPCAFTITARDAAGNVQLNAGADPGFSVQIVGTGGWAATGRVGEYEGTVPAAVTPTVTPVEGTWASLGMASCATGDYSCGTVTDMRKSTATGAGLQRGDTVVIGGQVLSVDTDPSATFSGTKLPLAEPYLGVTSGALPVYPAGAGTGKFNVVYKPTSRGTYAITVKTPAISAVQTVTTTGTNLSGTFTLCSAPATCTAAISYSATNTAMTSALVGLYGASSIAAVTPAACTTPATGCTWTVTFAAARGTVAAMLPGDLSALAGNGADVLVQVVVPGQGLLDVKNSPSLLTTVPGDASPAATTARGVGLYLGVAGDEARFVVQSKDAVGNDRCVTGFLLCLLAFAAGENADDAPAVTGSVTPAGDGAYDVAYVPTVAAPHTVVVLMSTAAEVQSFKMSFASLSLAGGSYTVTVGAATTVRLAWDAPASALAAALSQLPTGAVEATRKATTASASAFDFTVGFVDAVGDVPTLSVDATLLSAVAVSPTTVDTPGAAAHIKTQLSPVVEEVQVVSMQCTGTVPPQLSASATFTLSFRGYVTAPIQLGASDTVVQAKLNALGILNVQVVESTGAIPSSTYDIDGITANYPMATYPMVNQVFGGGVTSASNRATADGSSPFTADISPAALSAAHSTAVDQFGIQDHEGLSTGQEGFPAAFTIEARDRFGNPITAGPVKETQIVELGAAGGPALTGSFSVALGTNAVEILAGAGIVEFEGALESITGVGAITVSTDLVTTAVTGSYTAAVVYGSATAATSHDLSSQFAVGDWVRLCNAATGPVFTVRDITTAAITLSSPYGGLNAAACAVFRGDSGHFRYIVTFNSVLGDLPALVVDASNLNTGAITSTVLACDRYAQQVVTVATTPLLTPPYGGHFLLGHNNTYTAQIPYDDNGATLSHELTALNGAPVTATVLSSAGGDHQWSVTMTGAQSLLLPEGYLLVGSGALLSVEEDCPAGTAAGRVGAAWLVELLDAKGKRVVAGDASHLSAERYSASYVTPRVAAAAAAPYSLHVDRAIGSGLLGELWNNRWIYGDSVKQGVAQRIDFAWSAAATITDTGMDYISARWSGWVQPAFSEDYTFAVRVNDGARLWVDGALLFDKFENLVEDGQTSTFSGVARGLVAGRLYAIVLEFRENYGTAAVRLSWSSASQPLEVVPSQRLFYGRDPISGSPFAVTPVARKPSAPLSLALEIAAWDRLNATWAPPADDGGDDIDSYLVEWWPATAGGYGTPEVQQVVMPLAVDAVTHLDLLIQSLVQSSGISNGFSVRISAENSAGLGRPSDVATLKPWAVPAAPDTAELLLVPGSAASLRVYWTAPLKDYSATVASYVVEWADNADFAAALSYNDTATALACAERATELPPPLTYLISDLTPGASIYVRVSAISAAGTGPAQATTPAYLAVIAAPDQLAAGAGVTLAVIPASDTVSVADSSSSLLVRFAAPRAANGAAVTDYLVEWWVAEELMRPAVQVVANSDGVNGGANKGVFRLQYQGAATAYLTFDAEEAEVEAALQALPALRDVSVVRTYDATTRLYQWAVTFLSDAPSEKLGVYSSELLDSTNSPVDPLIADVLVAGQPGHVPPSLQSAEVDAITVSAGLTLTGLTVGRQYTARVSARNSAGLSLPQVSTPAFLAPPVQAPAAPRSALVSPAGATSLRVLWFAPESDGGSSVTKYKIEWDTTPDFNSGLDGGVLGSHQSVSTATMCINSPCEYVISSLTKGTPYHVRIFAYNAYGFSASAVLTDPAAESPCTQPQPPPAISVAPLSDTAVQATFGPSTDDGGRQVTSYRVEWDALGMELLNAGGSSVDALFGDDDVQSVTVSSAAANGLVGGTFYIANGGFATGAIATTASADDVAAALNALPTLAAVRVARKPVAAPSYGYEWVISRPGATCAQGGVLGRCEDLVVSALSTDLPSHYAASSTSASAAYAVRATRRITALAGFDQQVVTLAASGGALSGTFRLTYRGRSSAPLPVDASAAAVEDAVRALAARAALVVRHVPARTAAGAVTAVNWTVAFVGSAGSVTELGVDASRVAVESAQSLDTARVTAHASGYAPSMGSKVHGSQDLSAPGAFVIRGLAAGARYHVRVSAYNGVGFIYGPTRAALPLSVAPSRLTGAPATVEAAAASPTALRVAWAPPSDSGGAPVLRYRVDADVGPLSEVQTITAVASALDLEGYFFVAFGSSAAAAKVAVTASGDDVRTALEDLPTVRAGGVAAVTAIDVMGGRQWRVTFAPELGAVPLVLVSTAVSDAPAALATSGSLTGTAPRVSAQRVRAGGLRTSFTTPRGLLTPGAQYYTRVSAYTANGWGPSTAAIVGTRTAAQVPAPPTNVIASVASSTAIKVVWAAPESDGGAPVTRYTVQWSTSDAFSAASGGEDTVSAPAAEYTIATGLTTGYTYFVRVSASNSVGYSEPALAMAL